MAYPCARMCMSCRAAVRGDPWSSKPRSAMIWFVGREEKGSGGPNATMSACEQQRAAERVLFELPRLSSPQFTKACRAIQQSDSVAGPFAVAWLLGAAFRQKEPPDVRRVIEALQQDGRQMRKLRKANAAWGMDVWEVVHHREPKRRPRYCSEPVLHVR